MEKEGAPSRRRLVASHLDHKKEAKHFVTVAARRSAAGIVSGIQHTDGSFEPHPGYKKTMEEWESRRWWAKANPNNGSRVIPGVQHPDGSFEPHPAFVGKSPDCWWRRSCLPIPTEELTLDGQRVVSGVQVPTGKFKPHPAFAQGLTE